MNSELFGLKEVPDLYFCKLGTKEIVAKINTIKFSYNVSEGQYYLRFKDNLFKPEVIDMIEKELSSYDLYALTYKRNRDTGEDSSYCLKFSSLKFISLNFKLECGEDPAVFEYMLTADDKETVDYYEGMLHWKF